MSEVISQREFARRVGVGSSTVSRAVRKGWACGGYDMVASSVYDGDKFIGIKWPAVEEGDVPAAAAQSAAAALKARDRELLAAEKEEELVHVPAADSADARKIKPAARPSRSVFLEDRDAYLVSLPDRGPVLIDRASHEAMLRAYSSVPGPTVRSTDIARAAGLTPKEFAQYARVFGWTRKSLPVETAQLATSSDEEVLETLASERELRVRADWGHRVAGYDRSDARKWRNLKTAVLEPFHDVLDRVQAVPFREAKFSTTNDRGAHHLLIPLNDWQVGAFADEKDLRLGRQFDADVFRACIEDYVKQLTDYVADFNPTRVHFARPNIALLGDLIHGLIGETIHGTKLAKHMREFDWEQAEICLQGLYRICDAIIDLFGGFDLLSVAGNHEGPGAAQLIAEALRQRYREFDCNFEIPRSRTFHKMIGNSYFTFDHGASPDSGVKGGKIARSGPKRDDQIKTLVLSRPDLLVKAREQRGGVYFVMGDQHHTLDESGTGVELLKLPALPTGDRYADENLWHSRPAQAVVLIKPGGIAHMERFYFDNKRIFPQ